MELFDGSISRVGELVDGFNCKRYPYTGRLCLPVSDKSELVLLKEAAFELGGGELPCVGFNLYTEKPFESETVVVGGDLNDIRRDTPYARITVLSIKECEGEEQQLFDSLKTYECIKFSQNISGFMTRSSGMTHREPVRVSKRALKAGLSFQTVGETLTAAYLKNDGVRAVRHYFITSPDAAYGELYAIAEKTSQTVSALNHIYDNLLVDCASCNLKQICDEVEGMRDMHLGMALKKR